VTQKRYILFLSTFVPTKVAPARNRYAQALAGGKVLRLRPRVFKTHSQAKSAGSSSRLAGLSLSTFLTLVSSFLILCGSMAKITNAWVSINGQQV